MTNCRICNAHFDLFMDFGKMPRGNGFLTEKEFTAEYFYPLQAAFCPECFMVQIVEQPPREMMFHGLYPFSSASSESMKLHFHRLSEIVLRDYLSKERPFVVEIGSNDGTLLSSFLDRGVRLLGLEPAKNACDMAFAKGVKSLNVFFDERVAAAIFQAEGACDVILATNVMCHLANIHSVLDGVRLLLKPNGVFIFEDPYLGDVLAKVSFDQIYDEHVFIFSVVSAAYMLALHGLEIFDLEPIGTHGGSMRYYVGRRGERKISQRFREYYESEHRQKFHLTATYDLFRTRAESLRGSLLLLLRDLKQKGHRIIGYGATSKSATLLNYCGIGPDLIDFICDSTPLKQGKFSPGLHIPIVPPEKFQEARGEYALLFAWNHAREVFRKEANFVEEGGQWIVYVPHVEVINRENIFKHALQE